MNIYFMCPMWAVQYHFIKKALLQHRDTMWCVFIMVTGCLETNQYRKWSSSGMLHSLMPAELRWKVHMQARHQYSPRMFLFLNKYSANSKVQFNFTKSFLASDLYYIFHNSPYSMAGNIKAWFYYLERRNRVTIQCFKLPVYISHLSWLSLCHKFI